VFDPSVYSSGPFEVEEIVTVQTPGAVILGMLHAVGVQYASDVAVTAIERSNGTPNVTWLGELNVVCA
jgi:hypothetical protein